MSASPVVELNSEQDFSSANVTLAYNETGVQNESQDLAVFTYDPEAGIFVPLNSTVDAANNTATAETSHFSMFAVFDITNWAATYNATEPVRQTDDDGVQPVDVVMLLDASESMESEDPNRLAKDAAQRFTGSLLETDRAAVIEFDNFGRVKQPLTSNHTAVNRSTRDVDDFPRWHELLPLSAAVYVLVARDYGLEIDIESEYLPDGIRQYGIDERISLP